MSIHLFLNCISERCETYIEKNYFDNVYILINIYASIYFVHSYYIELFVTCIISTLLHCYLTIVIISLLCKYQPNIIFESQNYSRDELGLLIRQNRYNNLCLS